MWKRNVYDENALKEANWYLAETIICKNQPKAIVMQKYDELMDKCHRDTLKDNVKRKLVGDYGYGEKEAYFTAGDMIDNLPKELFYNVEEWLDDKEISELPYDGFSIKQFMECHKKSGRIYNFVICTELMAKFTQGHSKDDLIHSLCRQ